MFNLISTFWLPVRRLSGARAIIRPGDLTDGFDEDPILGLDFGRPDFDGAVTEFLIGLIAVARAPRTGQQWADIWLAPPTPADLAAGLEPFAPAFALLGEGRCCFQDLDPLAEAEVQPVTQLLIDMPGDNALKHNADHFTKRQERNFTLAEAAAALITLQTWSPAGGVGYRTSMRGGGPLTTLVLPERDLPGGGSAVTLWDRVWANVPQAASEPPKADQRLFPWLGPTRTSRKGEVVTPEDMHPLHVFFGMPRRVRLVAGPGGEVAGFRAQNYGMNYSGWEHPLTPYYRTAKDELLPVHPREGPASYRDWLAILFGAGAHDPPARVVQLSRDRFRRAGLDTDQIDRVSIAAFGYDMDNAKARGFVSQTIPWLSVPEGRAGEVRALMTALVHCAEAVAGAARYAVRLALFGDIDQTKTGPARLSLRDEGKKAAADVFHAFFSRTESPFRGALVDACHEMPGDAGNSLKRAFFDSVRRDAFGLYDAYVDNDALMDQFPERLVRSRAALAWALSPRNRKDGAYTKLNLPPEED